MTRILLNALFAGVIAAVAIAAGGCTTVQNYDSQFSPVYSSYRQGNPEAAATSITGDRYERKFRSNDRLLWNLEAAKLLHAAGRFEESNRYFEKAEEILIEFEERPEINVRSGLSGLGALVTNPAALPYQGTYSERILVNTYKALNYLAMGDLQGARVEIRRSYERQQQAVRENEAAIARARAEAQKHKLKPGDFDKPALRANAPVDPETAKAYADFANPFATFLSGLVALADEDPARAEVDFRLLAALPIPNEVVQRELELIQRHLAEGVPLPRRRVYVLFENGLGPSLEEMRVDLLLPDIGYTGFAFPRVNFRPTSVSGLRIVSTGGAEEARTEQVASTDQIIATDFQTRTTPMVLRTVSSVVAKEVLAKQVTDELDDIGLILSSLFKAVVNRADTRIWKTLGKEFQVAAFDYPESGVVRLSLIDQNKNELSARQEVELPDGDFVLLLARSVNSNDLHVTARSIR